MDEDIEFLTGLGADLQAAAGRERAADQRPHRPGWLAPLGVVAVVLVIFGAVAWAGLLRDSANEPSSSPTNRPVPQGIVAPLGPEIEGPMFESVDASGPDDVWAVGQYILPTGAEQALALHWDGRGWSVIPTPGVSAIRAISAVTPNDAWAIGDGLLHWDGRSWSTVTDVPAGDDINFQAIDASGPDDVWIAGTQPGARWIDRYGERNSGEDLLVLHWDGTRWSPIPAANPDPRHNNAQAVVALSPDDAWLVGLTGEGHRDRTLTEHWDGSRWSVVDSPNPGNHFNNLWAAGQDGQNGVWALGQYGDKGSGFQSLYLRWTGRAWQQAGPQHGKESHQTPGALSGTSAADIWAVGSENTSSFLIAHHTAQGWVRADAQLLDRYRNDGATLTGVVALSPDDAWAVGRDERVLRSSGHARSTLEPLMLRWDGTAWNPVDAGQPPRPSSWAAVTPSHLPDGASLADRTATAAPFASRDQLILDAEYALPGPQNAHTLPPVGHEVTNPLSQHLGTQISVTVNPLLTSRPLLPADPNSSQQPVTIAGHDGLLTEPDRGTGRVRVEWTDALGYHTVACLRLQTDHGLSGVTGDELLHIAESLYPAG